MNEAMRADLNASGADIPSASDLRITDVIPAAVAALDPSLPGADEESRRRAGIETGASQLLLILVDGLGYVPLSEYFGHASTLRRLRTSITPIHTIVPSTTAAAISSFTTGEMPGATRMTGFTVAYGQGLINMLSMEGGPAPRSWQVHSTYFERLREAGVDSAAIIPSLFSGSGLTGAALRGARHVGAESWDDRIRAAVRELRAGTPLVYLYWSEIDHAGHAHGVGSPQWIAQLEDFDRGLAALLSRIPSGVRTILTADHGMVNVDAGQLIDVARTPALGQGVRIIAGETRSVHVHAQAGAASDVEARWREVLGERAWIFSGEEIASLVGDGAGAGDVGDLLVLSKGRFGIVDSRTQSAAAIAMPGIHGSITPAEMLIPLARLS